MRKKVIQREDTSGYMQFLVIKLFSKFSTRTQLRTYMRFFIILIFIFSLISCSKCPEYECGIPESAIMEVATLGGTLSARGTAIPVNVDQEFVDGVEPFIFAKLALYFAPHSEYEIADFTHNGREISFANTELYEITFSQLVNNDQQEIEPTTTAWGPTRVNGYTSGATLVRQPIELVLTGNHLVNADSHAGEYAPIPARATHTELWLREQAGEDRVLVRRIPLSSFAHWNLYIKPLIDKNLL